MVDTTKAVATFLRSSPGVTFKVFENHRPRDVDDCITVVANGGVVVDEFLGTQDIIRKNMLILYIRSSQYPKAVQQASAVAKALKAFTVTITLDDFDICYGVRPIGGLEPLGVDDLGRAEVSISYNMYVKE